MNDALTLDELAVPLRALRLLAADFGHLPAPHAHVSTIYPNQLELSFHDGLTDFEAWRDALGIAPDAVECREQGGGQTRALSLTTDYAGAELLLVAYGDVLAPATAAGRDAR
ncbi:hypothetical protein [Streptomyces sp. 11-1-2]|uniref:hypothetical protein n=1 Tax=Streptomyces sp. 11-1-2 TaxID=1851167 RepID=UPI000B8D4BC4|nr:hypothetical protein [Streptomyces sp. 11-1-2]ASQ96014.1 hypothetical protein CGL27_25785 [Streptomyces sp. 11-1-2]